ncbi:hypothetical protein Tco_0864313 [Tanacetum coccineum]
MSGLVEDSEEDDDEEDEEIEESLDSDSVSEDAEDEGPTAEDEDPATGDEGLAAGVEGPGMDDEIHGLDDESHGLDEEGHSVESDGLGLEQEVEAVLEGHTFEVGQGSRFVPESERPERMSASRLPTLTTWTDPEDGMVYVDVLAYPPLTPPVQTPPSRGGCMVYFPISPSPSVIPLLVSSPMIPLTVPSPLASLTTAETKGFLTEPGAQVQMSLEYEQKRVSVTFGVIWRPVLALESWAGQLDAQRAALWHAISDMHGENRDLWL